MLSPKSSLHSLQGELRVDAGGEGPGRPVRNDELAARVTGGDVLHAEAARIDRARGAERGSALQVLPIDDRAKTCGRVRDGPQRLHAHAADAIALLGGLQRG